MYLKRLELHGFKSFADKTVLEFMPGITTVIGPNGSGKSNISDSIKWVLGEQSMKSLRGAKSEDVIFAGTQNRKSLGFAEASLIFDNSDGKLPVEYSEVTVTRKIYRSGESGYYINKVPCRLKDILELFMDTGIGKDGYSIIGQGKIDEILSNKSEDRRHIFEEAAGIVKYRARKGESEKKLEQTKLNLLRINDILSEIESNIGPLKNQAEKAKKFLNLREELKNIEVGLFLYNIDSNKEKLEKVQEDEKVLKNQNEQENEQMEQINTLKEEIKKKIEFITNQIENIQNIGFQSQKEKEQINSDINVAKERIKNNEENYKRYIEETKQTQQRNKELEEEKNLKIEKKNSLFENKEKFKKELAEKEEELKKIISKLSEKELEIENKKKEVSDKSDKKYEFSGQISGLEINLENLEKRQKTVNSEIQVAISELDSSRLTKEEISKTFYEIEKNRNEILNKLEDASKKQEESTRILKQYEDDISRKTTEMRMKEARQKFLIETEREKEGYTRSVKSLLLECDKNPSLAQGMHGVLANIISVDEKYQIAIEMALGAAIQNIVTETEDEAKKLVEHLRKFNLGRASFLPISTVKGKKIEKISTKGINKEEVYIASDLVKTDEKYRGIVLNLLGRTVIVEDMQNAIALAKQNNYTFKIVTLKGDIINPSGAITGGSVANKTVNILGRKKEIETLGEQIQDNTKKIELLEKEKQEYENSIQNVLEEVEGLQASLQEIDITYATDKQKVLAVDENIKKLEQRLNKLKEEIIQLEEQKANIIDEKDKKKNEIEKLTIEVQNLNKIIENYNILNKDNQKYIDDLNFDVTNLKISVSSFDESETSIDEIIERINQDIKNNSNSINSKKEQIAIITNDNEILKQDILNFENRIKKIEEDVNSSDEKINKLKQERKEANQKLELTEKEVLSQFEIIENIKAQVVKLEVKETKLQEDIESIINALWEEYELTPNNAEGFQKPENVSITSKRVNGLRNQIKELGSVNIDSIEEYKQTSQRYDFMCEQRLDLENSISKLRKVIQDMTTMMKEQFSVQFKMINQNFEEVFRELFGGGKAELVLTDEENILECGIDIRVQPPGKKLQNMNLLSGGEKAFTAIAILFAILKINPSPFCVLDEIEAALDDVNVYRFADYLKKFVQSTQFLVITHRKGTMEAADSVYGVTMEENGISKLLSMKLK